MELKGIDVSKWNGSIDFKKVRAAGIDFVMIKAANGSNKGTYTLDPKFDTNIRAAHSAGLRCGVYLYSYAKTPTGATGEAKFLAEKLAPYRSMISFPAAYDIEDSSQSTLSKTVITSMCANFCKVMRKSGFTPMIYANASWLTNKIDTASLDVDIWLAQWAAKPTWSGTYTMWQYSSKGNVAGISGAVDMNISYKDYANPSAESAVKSESGNTSVLTAKADTPSVYAASAWTKASAKGIMDGTNPQGTITREQVAVVLDRLHLL